MKRLQVLLLLFGIVILSISVWFFLKPTMSTSTTSVIEVLNKGHSDDYEQYWIKAFDPNNQSEKDAIKIIVDNENVWNLIEVKTQYFATYRKDGDKPWKLTQIDRLDKK